MFPHRLKRRGAALAALVVGLAVAFAFWWSDRRSFLERRASGALALVSADRIAKTTETLAARPYRAGAGADPAGAIEKRLSAAGLKTWNDLREADVWEPVSLRVALSGKDLDLRGDAKEPGFLAYSADGDVEAPLVYARLGTDADFEALRKGRVEPRGKVALVRAAACPAAAVAAAERAGAAAVLVYADPADDPEAGSLAPVGTLLRTYRRSGDPRRSKEQGIETLPRIPAVSIPKAAAETLLRETAGPDPPGGWKGALDAPYGLGPSKARVKVSVKGKTARAKLRSVLASLPGTDQKAPPVLVMSHYDSLGAGGAAAAAGAVLLETADVLGRLAADGWRPTRGVVFALWDGGAYGGLGSTAWVEAHAGAAGLPAAAVLEVTSVERAGPLSIALTPGLRAALDEALARVPGLGGGGVPVSVGSAGFPSLCGDAAPFLGLTPSPVVSIGFGRLSAPSASPPQAGGAGARRATLAGAVALFAGELADPRLFPFRFGELVAYAQRELRETQARQPSASGWLPGAVRGLDRPLDSLDAAAASWDDYAQSRIGRARDRARSDELGSLALASLGSPGAFGRGCALWGPSETTGCVTSGFPALEDAVRRRDRDAVDREIVRLAAGFTRAREYLVAADWLGRGKAKPREKRPRIPVKE